MPEGQHAASWPPLSSLLRPPLLEDGILYSPPAAPLALYEAFLALRHLPLR